MASDKKKNAIKEKLTLTLRFPRYAGYADSFLATSASVQIKNTGSETLVLTVGVESELTVPYETEISVPFESSVELNLESIFSPLFLAENDELKACPVGVFVRFEGKEVLREQTEITALPFDWWEGLEGNAERVAAFVRPRISECSQILAEAGKRLKKWKADTEFYGYTGAGKNDVHQIAAAVFGAVRQYSLAKSEKTDLSVPVCAFREGVLKERAASSLQLALLAASCFEAAHLHPVIALGKTEVGVGVWLYDSCFLDSVTDDNEIVEKYVSEGINNLSFFDTEDMFTGKNVPFTPAEEHFRQKLKAGMYEYFVDVRRCRLGRVLPCPVRGKGLYGYELYKEEDNAPPAPIPEYKKLGLSGKQPKNKQWERRLLDLTAKNALLNFTGKNALRVRAAGMDELYRLMDEKGNLRIKCGAGAPLSETLSPQERELLLLEEKKGLLRVDGDAKSVAETAVRLMRRNREADEETGAKILYMAFGFLRYTAKEDGKAMYAPLVLSSAGLKRAKGNEDFSVELTEKEYFVNSTLLEYLKQEFNIDVRGLGGDVSALKISEICAMVRAETANMKGWGVSEDVFLSAFSFQSYLMWNDVRQHITEFKKNAIVAGLLSNRMGDVPAVQVPEEDESNPLDPLMPLPFDSSQYSAVALAGKGESFVLHGPPGTGKSQTITNMIANALYQGKRVLFVAEKKAALDVVKKRLDGLGIGDFCLEIHSNKTDKTEFVKHLEETLALPKEEGADGIEELAEEICALKKELKDPMRALHKKRRLGVSVYQAILLYLQNRNAPDILDIESSFYDTLTEKKLAECKNMILSAAAAAKECGGVFNSPFENINLTSYSRELRDKVLCASEVLVTEIKHLKSFLALFLEFYRQKISTLTQKKLSALCALCEGLLSGEYNRYFADVEEEAFYLFYNANRRLDACLEYYYKHFKALVELGKEYDEIKKVCEEGGDYRFSRAAVSVVKKLSRTAVRPLKDEDVPKFLQTLVDIYDAVGRIKTNTKLAKNFTDRSGNIVYKKRTEFLASLNDLHKKCASVFMDYNPDAFNGMCVRASNGYTVPVLNGCLKAAESFLKAQDSFLAVTCADRAKIKDEDVLDYFSAKAGALIDNVDMLPNWCMYRSTAQKLSTYGLNFITDALENGKLKAENVLAGFEKNVYKNFLEINLPADTHLSRMTAGTIDETIEKFRITQEEFARLSKERIRKTLISRLPDPEGGDGLGVEISTFRRLAKGNLRGTGVRGLLAEVPALIAKLAPCLLMSPTTVAQYLQPVANDFDLVIFDEASQMSTAEAVGSIARAKAAVVVGDPKQLPPTAFFRSAYVDEENLENEDLESVLDDCLALGMKERHLLWHYRSKHESLIAFSNSMYYDNRLCTFPSPDSLESKVRLIPVDGVYDRGFTKRNKKEAEALVKEVIRRLSDPVLSRSSMGVVTFSGAQQEDVERLLTKEIAAHKLESVAYNREEPIFVKNLENVQGDERDVILFSVCYGPDKTGRVSLNFGPLNQAGGWRRLNVAVSRAREEMLIFSTMSSGMIDLHKTSSKGVAGLKAFLEFAERGRTTLAVKSSQVKSGAGIGKFIAAELSSYGYECRADVGASDFKIDVAVVDPKNKHRFILAVICDGNSAFSVKDRNLLQVLSLRRGNWNVIRVNSVNYFNNPKRETKRIKDLLDKLTGVEKKAGGQAEKYAKPYRAVKTTASETAAYITGGENDSAILARLKEIVATEEPISRAFLKKRCLATFGIAKSGSKVDSRLDALIDACAFSRERVQGVDYYYKNARAVTVGKFRKESGTPLRKAGEDFTPFETVTLIKGALEEKVALYADELLAYLCGMFPAVRGSADFAAFVRDCVSYGEEKGILFRSVSDRITLA